MKLRENHWLEERIRSWAKEGLIAESQAEAILRKNRAEAKANAPKALTLLSALGALCLALGVILVVSHNWENIPRVVKIGVFLLLLAVAALGFERASGKSPVARGSWLIVWLLLPLAGIGLWGQMYQLSGDPFLPLAIWLALTATLIAKTAHPPAAFLYAAGWVAALFTGAMADNPWLQLDDLYESKTLALIAFRTTALFALWAAGFWIVVKTLGDRGRWAFTLAFCVFLFTLQAADTPFHMENETGVVLAINGALFLYGGLADLLRRDENPWRNWGLVLLAANLYGMTFLWHARDSGSINDWGNGLALTVILAAAVLWARVPPARLASDAAAAAWFKVLAAVPVVLSALMTLGDSFPPQVAAIFANLALIGLALWLMREGVAENRPGRINTGVILGGFVVVSRFFDYFDNLLDSGLAFLVMGCLLVGLALGLEKGRRKLLEKAGRKTP